MLDQILAFSRLLVFGVNGYLRDTSQIYGIGKPPKFTGLGYIPNLGDWETSQIYWTGIHPKFTGLGYIPNLRDWDTSQIVFLKIMSRGTWTM